MLIASFLGKSRDEPIALETLLLGAVTLFYSTLPRLKSISIIQGNYLTCALSFVTSCHSACLLRAHTPARLNNYRERDYLSDKSLTLCLSI